MSILGLLSSFLLPNFSSIQSKAKESALKQVGNSIQIGLESYYLTEGTYPTTALSGEALITTLKNTNSVTKTPNNPFTNTSFRDSDSSGKIEYDYSSDTEGYTLTLYGYQNSTIIKTLENY